MGTRYKNMQIIIKLARGFHKGNQVQIPWRWRNDFEYLYGSRPGIALDLSAATITEIAAPNHSS